MNSKVKQLAEQAGGMVLAGSEIEKFARLIVEECADVGSKFSQAHPDDIRHQIKKHFGVN